jgi:hypothetical protein
MVECWMLVKLEAMVAPAVAMMAAAPAVAVAAEAGVDAVADDREDRAAEAVTVREDADAMVATKKTAALTKKRIRAVPDVDAKKADRETLTAVTKPLLVGVRTAAGVKPANLTQDAIPASPVRDATLIPHLAIEEAPMIHAQQNYVVALAPRRYSIS